MEIVKYKLSSDKKGLLAYFRDAGKLSYYHVHCGEMSRLEKFIGRLLKNNKKGK